MFPPRTTSSDTRQQTAVTPLLLQALVGTRQASVGQAEAPELCMLFNGRILQTRPPSAPSIKLLASTGAASQARV